MLEALIRTGINKQVYLKTSKRFPSRISRILNFPSKHPISLGYIISHLILSNICTGNFFLSFLLRLSRKRAETFLFLILKEFFFPNFVHEFSIVPMQSLAILCLLYRIVRRSGLGGHCTIDTDGRRIVGRVQTNPYNTLNNSCKNVSPCTF